MTWEQAIGAVMSAGQPFDLAKAVLNSIEIDKFKNAPPQLGFVFAAARQEGDKTILVYTGERRSFSHAADRLDALA